MATIEVNGLWKAFGDNQVLKGVSLSIEKGTTYVVLGASGSGKTVLLKHVIGLLRPDRGTIHVNGVDLATLAGKQLTDFRQIFGMVFQGAALFDSMTVLENVAFPLHEKNRRLSWDELRARVVDKLRVVDLGEEILELWPAQLSGGMRKRVSLARALVAEPEVVLYDEPTTGLDPITTDSVDGMIDSAKERLGVTSMVISHDIASAFKVADRLAVLYDGRIAAQGTPEEVRRSQDPYVQKFLALWFGKQ
jgi:phospholipid/cholesterol/gamma-HCH transport system ATP-binding protein